MIQVFFFANKGIALIDDNVIGFVSSLNVIITVVIVVCDWVFFVIVIITPITISLLLSPPPPPSTSSSSSSSSSWTWKALARFTYQFYEKNIDLSCSSQSTIIVLWYPVFPHSCISWKAPGSFVLELFHCVLTLKNDDYSKIVTSKAC